MRPVNTPFELYTAMRPDTQDHHVGIEVEFYCPLPRDLLAIDMYKQSFAKFVCLGADGSILAPVGYTGHELRVLVKQSQVRFVVARICKYLARIGAKVNSTCGLHVHLDMRNRDPKKAYQNLQAIQNILLSMNPAARATGGYCSPSPFDFDTERALNSRWRAVNLHALRYYNTIEVRVHAGSVDANEICNWVSLLVRAVNAAPYKKSDIATLQDLRAKLRFGDRTEAYVKEKLKRYGGKIA